ncbi:MAG: fatty acid desaturase [Planctomycetes bacterium]|nr:fatty acid desaturase [Planctomycetota bacterium]MCW8135757.1 fatty acid desaturase [Planctomycetota bacterium]
MTATIQRAPDEKVNWRLGTVLFAGIHLLPFAAIYTGVHWSAWIIMAVLYFSRVFFLTGGYHRYFSHRTYRMGRVMQFLMALGATTAGQKGPLWWAAHHRHHHKYSDEYEDIHSPKRGFWWSHMGWIMCKKYEHTQTDLIPDFAKYPELRLLDKFDMVPPLMLGIAVWLLGYLITGTAMGATGVLLIGFFLSTIFTWHSTFTVNSLAHVFGRRRFATRDTSRNNLWIALATGGEGWHNNHHHYPGAACQGFYWWEIDTTYYVLKLMSKVGLVSGLRRPPEHILQKHLIKQGAADLGMFQTHWERAVKALADAQARAGGMAAEQKQALEELLVSTRAKIEELAKASAEKAGDIARASAEKAASLMPQQEAEAVS